MKTLFFSILFSLVASVAFSQSTTVYTSDSIDIDYGIVRYKKYNDQYGAGEKRMCNGTPCNGYVTDLYATGEKLHKGYYVEGVLRIFKNFYPDGTVEREFKWIDDHKCSLKTYHPNGQLHSKIKYIDGNPVEWEDYYANGQLDFIEKYDKNFEFFLIEKSYAENGKAQFEMELVKRSKYLYHKKEYDEDGNLIAEGPVQYYTNMGVYLKKGWWTVYNQSGAPIRKEEFINGTLTTLEELSAN